MVEDGFVVAYVVEGGELGSVQKAAAAQAVDGQEVSDFRAAEAYAREPPTVPNAP